MDQFGAPMSNRLVDVGASGSGVSLSPDSGLTNEDGIFTTLATSVIAQDSTVMVTIGTSQFTTPLIFVAGPVAAVNSVMTASPTTLESDGTAQTALDVVLRDAFGNVVPGVPVALQSTGVSNSLGSTTGTTDGTGTFTTTLSSTVAQEEYIIATFASGYVAHEVTFVSWAPSASTSTLNASAPSLVADGTTATTLTLTVLNSEGNPVADQAVSLTASGSDNAFSPSSGTTDSSGVFVSALSSATAQSETVTASFGASSTLSTSVTFVAGPASPTDSRFVASSSTVVADATSTTTLTLTVRDSEGNPVSGQAVSLAGSGTSNTFSNASGTTNSSGVFVSTLRSGMAQTETVTATFGSSTLSTPVTFTAGVPNFSASSFAVSTSSLTADGTSTTTLTVTVTDRNGNPVSGQRVTFSASGSANTFSAATGTTGSSGVFTSTLSSTKAQAETVTASLAAGFSFAKSVLFVAGSLASVSVAVSPGSVAAGYTPVAVTLETKDAHGNPVAAQAVSLTSNGESNVFTMTSGTTDTNGLFETWVTSTVAQTETITATAGSFTGSASVTFIPGSVAYIGNMTATPSSVVADGTTAITVAGVAIDMFGNAVPGAAVSFGAINDIGTSTSASSAFSPTTATTDTYGSFSTSVTSIVAQAAYVTASFTLSESSVPVTFTPGAPSTSTSTFAASSTSLTADGVTTTSLTVTVFDAHNNPINGNAVTLAASGTANTFGSSSGTTNSSGVFTTTLKSTKAQTETITATIASGTTLTKSITFVPGAPAPNTSTIVASPTSLTADGTSASTLTITVLDPQGNPISGDSVTLSALGTGNTLTPTSGTTNSSGVLTATLASTVAQSKAVTAQISTSAAVSTTVAFVPGAPSFSHSTLTNSATSVAAGGSVTLTATFHDAHGNAITGQTVSFAASPSGPMFSPSSGTTNSEGVATTTVSATVAHAETFTATLGSASATTTVTVTPGPPYTTSFVASPTSLTVGSTSTFTLSLHDYLGNPVSAAVYFTGTGSNLTLSPPSGSTGSTGTLTATLTTTNAQTASVTASFGGGATLTASATFAPGSPVVSSTTLAVTGGSGSVAEIPNDNSTAATATATAYDQYSNPVPGTSIVLAVTGSGNTVTPSATVTTNSSGQAVYSITSSAGGPKSVSATIGGTAAGTAQPLIVDGTPIATAVSPIKVSGSLSSCTTAYSNTGQKVAISSANYAYILFNSDGTAYVATSFDGGATYSAPVSTGLNDVIEIAIGAGPGGLVEVAAYLVSPTTSATEIWLATSNDAGATWSSALLDTPTPPTDSGVYEISVIPSVLVAYNTEGGPTLATGGGIMATGAPDTGYFTAMFDPGTGYVYLPDGMGSLYFIYGSNAGINGPFALASATQVMSAWALGGGSIYNAGDTTNMYRIPISSVTSDSPTSTSITGITQGIAGGVAVAADSSGNAYSVVETSEGAIVAQLGLATGTSLDTGTTIVSSDGHHPGIAAGASNAALVTYTAPDGVYATVLSP